MTLTCGPDWGPLMWNRNLIPGAALFPPLYPRPWKGMVCAGSEAFTVGQGWHAWEARVSHGHETPCFSSWGPMPELEEASQCSLVRTRKSQDSWNTEGLGVSLLEAWVTVACSGLTSCLSLKTTLFKIHNWILALQIITEELTETWHLRCRLGIAFCLWLSKIKDTSHFNYF